jgi:hypothetical protein
MKKDLVQTLSINHARMRLHDLHIHEDTQALDVQLIIPGHIGHIVGVRKGVYRYRCFGVHIRVCVAVCMRYGIGISVCESGVPSFRTNYVNY